MSKHKKLGFTIVELLIVVVVIAILAAITIVAYTGIQNRAHDSAVQNDMKQFATILEIYKTDNGTYPSLYGLTPSMGIKLTKASYGRDGQSRNASYCFNATTGQYIFYVLSKSGNFFQIRTIDGLKVQSTTEVTGYNICNRVGVSSTQPNQGLQPGGWESWTN